MTSFFSPGRTTGYPSTASTDSWGLNLMDQLDRDRRRSRGWSILDLQDEDPILMRYRGLMLLCGVGLSAVFFGIGFWYPVVGIKLFPGSAMEHWEQSILKSLWGIIQWNWENGNHMAAVTTFVTCVLLPIFELFGSVLIIIDSFFAKGFDFGHMLSYNTRNTIVGIMCYACSYQVVMFFVPTLVLCFFTSGATAVEVKVGFYFYCLYCLFSIVFMHLMEFMKERAPTEVTSPEGITRFRVDSIFPDLPGLIAPRDLVVDTVQVLLLSILFVLLMVAGVWQPLLELHIILEGLTLQKKQMSMWDVTFFSGSDLTVHFLFVVLVLVIPVCYCLLLITAGVVKLTCWDRCCNADALNMKRAYGFAVWAAGLLRPFAMTDVFAISIAVFLYSMQGDFLVTTIAPGPIPGLQNIKLEFFSGFYSIFGAGMAMFFLRWKWYCEDAPPEKGYTGFPETMIAPEQREKGTWELPHLPKLCWCMLWWIGACLGLHCLPELSPALAPFRLETANNFLNGTLPMVNKLLATKVTNALGSCNSTHFVPQPCQEQGVLYHAMDDTKRYTVMWVSGLNTVSIKNLALHHARDHARVLTPAQARGWSAARHRSASSAYEGEEAKHDKDTIVVKQQDQGTQKSKDTVQDSQDVLSKDGIQGGTVTGAAQLAQTDDASISPQPELSDVSSTSPRPGAETQYKISMKGEIRHLNIFLRVELCNDKHGNGCKILIDSNSTCCEDNRQFQIEIALQCRKGMDPAVRVTHFELDEVTINAVMDGTDTVQGLLDKQKQFVQLPEKALGLQAGSAATSMVVALPKKDITTQVKSSVKSFLTDILTKQNVVKWGKRNLNLQQLLGRAVRFSAKDNVLVC